MTFRYLAFASLLTFMVMLTGCSSSPVDPAVVRSGDYGPYPEDYEQTVHNYFQEILKDPMSAQYRITSPSKAYLRDAPIAGGKPTVFGYIVYVGVNAKNGFGGYTGEKVYRLFLKGSTVYVVHRNQWFNEPWYQ
jgi:hypothetical protein